MAQSRELKAWVRWNNSTHTHQKKKKTGRGKKEDGGKEIRGELNINIADENVDPVRKRDGKKGIKMRVLAFK